MPTAMVESRYGGARNRPHPEGIEFHRAPMSSVLEGEVAAQRGRITPPVDRLRIARVELERMMQICSSLPSFIAEDEPEHLIPFGEVRIECYRPPRRPQRLLLCCLPIVVSPDFTAPNESDGPSKLRPGGSKLRIDSDCFSQGIARLAHLGPVAFADK